MISIIERYPKTINTLRMAHHIYHLSPLVQEERNGIHEEYVDNLKYVISKHDKNKIFGECLVFDGNKLIDGFIQVQTNHLYNGKLISEYINENI